MAPLFRHGPGEIEFSVEDAAVQALCTLLCFTVTTLIECVEMKVDSDQVVRVEGLSLNGSRVEEGPKGSVVHRFKWYVSGFERREEVRFYYRGVKGRTARSLPLSTRGLELQSKVEAEAPLGPLSLSGVHSVRTHLILLS
ncbi:hypothetical protein Tco_0888774 [Tanacetum coccineum]